MRLSWRCQLYIRGQEGDWMHDTGIRAWGEAGDKIRSHQHGECI